MALIIAILAFGYAFSSLLSGLNVRHMAARIRLGLPEGLAGRFDIAQLSRMADYNRDHARLGYWDGLMGLAATVAIMALGILPALARTLAASAMPLALQGLAALYLPLLALWLAGIPGSLASSFGVERRYGFSTITPATWLADQTKGLAVSGLLMGLLFFGFYLFIQWLGSWWWLAAWALVSLFTLLVSFVAPVLLAPLFNKFTPIADQALQDRILDLARQARFPLAGVFQMDASKRSTHDNAYFTGLGRTRRIVFYDTMLQDYGHGELLSVLGHEIGHWKLGHIPRTIIISSALSGLMLWLVSLLLNSEWLYGALGLAGLHASLGLAGPVVGVALLVASVLFSPLSLALSPLLLWISRRHEYQSDAFAVRLFPQPGEMKGALVKLARRNLSNLFPHPLYVAFHYSHPPLLARLAAIDKVTVSSS